MDYTMDRDSFGKDRRSSERKEHPATPAVTIREMELEDMPGVYALGERLFTAEKWPALYRTWDEYEVVELFASDGEFCLVAEAEDGQVAGFALGALLEKRRSAWSYGYLIWMGVDPDLKGKGVGRKLLQELTDLFIDAGARMMLVDTAGDNDGALRFFRSQGFGHELEHVYLSRNLVNHPRYLQKKAQQKTMRRTSKHKGPKPTEIITPSVLEPPEQQG